MKTNTATVLSVAFGCITLMVVTALLMGHGSLVLTAGVTAIASAVTGILGIAGGGKAKEKKIKRCLDKLHNLKGE